MFEFKMTLSKNQSELTQCCLDKRRMCRPLPSIIMFIEDSLSWKKKQTSTITGLSRVSWNAVSELLSRVGSLGFQLTRRVSAQLTLKTSHIANASNPSNLKPVSNDITSASVLLCDTAVCFSHTHDIGTNVWITKCTMTWILKLSNHQQNRRFGTRPAYTHWLHLQHDNIDNNPMCISHILSVSLKTLVTRTVPFFHSSRQRIECPQDAWSTESCDVNAFTVQFEHMHRRNHP